MDDNDLPEVQAMAAIQGQNEPVRKNISLTSLSAGMPGLTIAAATRLAEAAAVCLEHRSHRERVCLPQTGLMVAEIDLEWPPVTEQARRCYADLQEATEAGASGVAILVVKETTNMVVVDRSAKGTGFDYWIDEEDCDDLPFAKARRLEISGILEGTDIQIKARIKQKKEQMKPTDHVSAGYVAVVEFSRPLAHVEMK